ncbi:Uncharacterised protein [Grimontia hollisae]|uniref:Uncharacterized protein n=1 Tax=Grimontia hollisae TaxID=673 RepID=A0A377HN64_GRIHO|nr:Uncharacterised protein [Grimontia hollisae]STO57670.1 Uncharacterised protein [Grimontia hollisae]STQ75449.1 Uncharacterised protein [Grimontia hollisae]
MKTPETQKGQHLLASTLGVIRYSAISNDS